MLAKGLRSPIIDVSVMKDCYEQLYNKLKISEFFRNSVEEGESRERVRRLNLAKES